MITIELELNSALEPVMKPSLSSQSILHTLLTRFMRISVEDPNKAVLPDFISNESAEARAHLTNNLLDVDDAQAAHIIAPLWTISSNTAKARCATRLDEEARAVERMRIDEDSQALASVRHRRQERWTMLARGLVPLVPTRLPSSHAARSALGDILTELLNVQDPAPGASDTTLSQSVSTKHSGRKTASCCARHGRETKAVPGRSTMCDTSAQGVVQSPMEPSNALVHRRLDPLTPHRAEVWIRKLQHAA
ncbi:hypothetical protein DFH29DRAFT_1077542 [Suillus ampliporus]|nr:hypothetical protein DFH29DRAFT_1077542 [Suillus ampliporus]